MKIKGKYILQFDIEFDDGTKIPYINLRRLFFGDDYDLFDDVFKYNMNIDIDDYYGFNRVYRTYFNYLTSIGLLRRMVSPGEEYYIPNDLDKLKKELDETKVVVSELLNNYDTYEREFLLENLME